MKLKITKPSIVKMLYQMLYDTHQLLTVNNIKYFIDGGSFLGAIRHKGLISWDDDIDIGIMQNEVKKFLSLKKDFKKCGYSISKVWFGYKIFLTNKKLLDGFNYSFPFIDVLIYKKIDNLYKLAYKAARDEWPKEIWTEEQLFPLKLYKYGSYEVYGPNDHKQYFDSYYGNDWNKIAYREYDHEAEEEVEKIKVKLTPAMRKPAKPYDQVIDRRCTQQCIKNSKKFPSPKSFLKKSTKSCSRSGECYNNFVKKMGVYVINCKMHVDRYTKFKKYAKKAKVKACRIPCVLGKKFINELVCDMIKQKLLSNSADMNAIEVSINMSHFNAWQRIVNSCLDYGLILEDDVELDKDFIHKLNNILQTLQDKDIEFSVLHLFNGNWMKTISYQKKITKVGNIEILREMVPYNAGAAGYIISKEYAKFLISKFFPIKIPNDILVGSYPKHGNHLTLKNMYDKKQQCYVSPLFTMPCEGEGGTGETTQSYEAPTIKEISCRKC